MKIDYEKLYQDAHEAGMKDVENLRVTPMIVSVRENPLDDSSRVIRSWYVEAGPCGFAWVIIKPANGRFAKYLLKNNIARPDSYYGGVCLWVRDFGQSVEMKYAYAKGFARVLQESGIKCYASSRMD